MVILILDIAGGARRRQLISARVARVMACLANLTVHRFVGFRLLEGAGGADVEAGVLGDVEDVGIYAGITVIHCSLTDRALEVAGKALQPRLLTLALLLNGVERSVAPSTLAAAGVVAFNHLLGGICHKLV